MAIVHLLLAALPIDGHEAWVMACLPMWATLHS